MFEITKIDKSKFPEVLQVWEASIRATHHFLKEVDIAYFKPLILNTYLDAVALNGARNSKAEIIGFSGVSKGNLKMLFIRPEYRGHGIGTALLEHAIHNFNVTKVDVNEQNVQAVRFYQKHGFAVSGRSETDATGKPYPILHMKFRK